MPVWTGAETKNRTLPFGTSSVFLFMESLICFVGTHLLGFLLLFPCLGEILFDEYIACSLSQWKGLNRGMAINLSGSWCNSKRSPWWGDTALEFWEHPRWKFAFSLLPSPLNYKVLWLLLPVKDDGDRHHLLSMLNVWSVSSWDSNKQAAGSIQLVGKLDAGRQRNTISLLCRWSLFH